MFSKIALPPGISYPQVQSDVRIVEEPCHFTDDHGRHDRHSYMGALIPPNLACGTGERGVGSASRCMG